MRLIESIKMSDNEICLADRFNKFECECCGHFFFSHGRYDSNFYDFIKGAFCYCPECHFNGFGEYNKNIKPHQMTIFECNTNI